MRIIVYTSNALSILMLYMNRNVLSDCRKVSSVQLGSLSSSGREFQTVCPATENARRRVCCVGDVVVPAGRVYLGGTVMVWHSGSALVSINEVNLRRARLVLRWVTVSITGAGHLSRYVTSHPSQLSLAIPSWVGAMSTSQRALTPCSWGVKAGMVCVWVAGKTV